MVDNWNSSQSKMGEDIRMNDEEDILAEQIGAAGAMGAGRFGGAAGARLGGSFTARLLPNNIGEFGLTLEAPLGVAVNRVVARLQAEGGPLRELEQYRTEDKYVFQMLTHAGFFNMNPTVVTVTLWSADAGHTNVHVRSVAKEGLIKQRSGEKAAQRIHAALSSLSAGA